MTAMFKIEGHYIDLESVTAIRHLAKEYGDSAVKLRGGGTIRLLEHTSEEAFEKFQKAYAEYMELAANQLDPTLEGVVL